MSPHLVRAFVHNKVGRVWFNHGRKSEEKEKEGKTIQEKGGVRSFVRRRRVVGIVANRRLHTDVWYVRSLPSLLPLYPSGPFRGDRARRSSSCRCCSSRNDRSMGVLMVVRLSCPPTICCGGGDCGCCCDFFRPMMAFSSWWIVALRRNTGEGRDGGKES